MNKTKHCLLLDWSREKKILFTYIIIYIVASDWFWSVQISVLSKFVKTNCKGAVDYVTCCGSKLSALRHNALFIVCIKGMQRRRCGVPASELCKCSSLAWEHELAEAESPPSPPPSLTPWGSFETAYHELISRDEFLQISKESLTIELNLPQFLGNSTNDTQVSQIYS